MLWTKAWLETRWRLAHVVGLVLLMLFMAESGGGLGSEEHAANLMMVLSLLSIFAAVNLAGAGIRTQSPVRAGRGLHGSMYFTLALPVSRLRLLAVRAGYGLLATALVVTFMMVSAWSLFSLVRRDSTLVDLARLIVAAVVCSACFYFISVSIATVLDELWQVYGSLCLIGAAWVLVSHLPLPPSANVFAFVREASPLLTHRLPWPAMFISLTLSVLLFAVAWQVVERREY